MAAIGLLRHASYTAPCASTLGMDFHPCVTFELYSVKCSPKNFLLFPLQEWKEEQNKMSELWLYSKAAALLPD